MTTDIEQVNTLWLGRKTALSATEEVLAEVLVPIKVIVKSYLISPVCSEV